MVEAKKLSRFGAPNQYTRSYVIYRRQMLKLLAYPKPAFDQLVIELPCLMGFRSREVALWKAEYIDFYNGETMVFDIKKKALFTVPLNIEVASHAEAVLKGRTEGYVFRNRSRAYRGRTKPVSNNALWGIWKKWALRAGLPNWMEMSPLVGRRFFASEWFHGQKLSLMTLSMIMRHSDPQQTLAYVNHLIFFEDLKRDYKQFQLNFIQKDVKKAESMVAPVQT